MRDIETKLSAAATRLILDKPFLGALVLRLPMVAGDPRWCRTTATDARRLYYNPDYIDALTLEQTQFVLAHEALHCGLSHFARRKHRNKQRWDVACDLAVNPLLLRDGLKPPPGALNLPQFEDMTAEEIYPCLDENNDDAPMDQHLYDAGDEREQQGQGGGREREQQMKQRPQPQEGEEGSMPPPTPLSETERERLDVQWRQRLAGAAQQALQAGKLSAGMARLVDHLLQPQLPWRMLLARYLTAAGRDDYNYTRPSRREGEAIMPSLRSAQIDVAVVLDTSGSISDAEMREFLAEIDAIKGQVRAKILLHACDTELAPDGPWEYDAWESFTLPREFSGGGGTSFIPPFDWLKAKGRRPDLLVYFTDAEGEFPQQEPECPVIWLVKGRAKVPWGVRIQLN
jgi:predicted metal-dependent peptidase